MGPVENQRFGRARLACFRDVDRCSVEVKHVETWTWVEQSAIVVEQGSF